MWEWGVLRACNFCPARPVLVDLTSRPLAARNPWEPGHPCLTAAPPRLRTARHLPWTLACPTGGGARSSLRLGPGPLWADLLPEFAWEPAAEWGLHPFMGLAFTRAWAWRSDVGAPGRPLSVLGCLRGPLRGSDEVAGQCWALQSGGLGGGQGGHWVSVDSVPF